MSGEHFDYGKQPWDEQDKQYLKKMIDKVISGSDGKTPIHQLSDEDVAKWTGVNIQGQAMNEPKPDEDTLALYMVDADRKLIKRFTITKSLLYLLSRGTRALQYGTSDPEGHQTKIILQWEKEKRT